MSLINGNLFDEPDAWSQLESGWLEDDDLRAVADDPVALREAVIYACRRSARCSRGSGSMRSADGPPLQGTSAGPTPSRSRKARWLGVVWRVRQGPA